MNSVRYCLSSVPLMKDQSKGTDNQNKWNSQSKACFVLDSLQAHKHNTIDHND